MLDFNGFRLAFSSTTFTAHQQAMPDNKQLRPLRERLGTVWFLYWDEGTVFGLPRKDGAPQFGDEVELEADQHLKLLAARIEDVLPYLFPEYQAFRQRPFTFLGRKDELVSRVKPRLSTRPALLECFKIRPKFELDARLTELQDGAAFIGLFMLVHTRWEILASLDALAAAGVDQELQAAWAAGLGRLTTRQAFPRDRESFFHRPLELLGICLGARTSSAIIPEHRQWLVDVV